MSVPDPSTTDWVPIYAGAPAFEYVGDYVPATNYKDGDIVVYNGTPWLCVKPTNTPPETFPMDAGAQLTYEGDFVAATEYQDGDVVVKDGIAYLCVGGPTTVAPDPVPWGAAMMVAAVPTGGLMQFAAETPPAGWLLCDGASLLRSSYAALFGVIGTIYGSVDGTHFNLPDLRGRIPVGKGLAGTGVESLGQNEGVTVDNRSPKHKHTVSDPGHAHTIYDPGHVHYGAIQAYAYTDSYTGMETYGAAMGNVAAAGTGIGINPAGTGIGVGPSWAALDSPAYIAVNYIIKI